MNNYYAKQYRGSVNDRQLNCIRKQKEKGGKRDYRSCLTTLKALSWADLQGVCSDMIPHVIAMKQQVNTNISMADFPANKVDESHCTWRLPKPNTLFLLTNHWHLLHCQLGMFNPHEFRFFLGDTQKGHGVDFDNWKFEVESLLRDGTHSERVLAPYVRQSIRGEPSRLIQTLGPNASIRQLIQELEASYGTVQDGPALLQKAYNSHQEVQESAAAFGRRLKLLVFDVSRCGGLPQSSMDTVLRQIYWRGLRDPDDPEHVPVCPPPQSAPPPATPRQPFSEAVSQINSTLAELKVALHPTAPHTAAPPKASTPANKPTMTPT
ncbi:uncharacterized protein LOC119726836 [Patiria miniata]|uniref:Uncharacterized protein n=1 Tax=Patiria miniata TaxID=46514 RepID=A0A913ZTT7_PATMI|nr:uncharacterized protein LOC119726836 [Patiria miniata]